MESYMLTWREPSLQEYMSSTPLMQHGYDVMTHPIDITECSDISAVCVEHYDAGVTILNYAKSIKPHKKYFRKRLKRF